jgi:hypothetical protein
MKKLLFVFFLIISVGQLSAQINKGQWLAGGAISFSAYQQAGSSLGDATSFIVSPNAGYFFIHNLAGGLRVNFQTTNQKEVKAYTQYVVSPFVRYYFLPAEQKVNVFADASYGFGSGNNGYNSQSINQYSFSAGPAIFLSPNTALEFVLSYASVGGGNAAERSSGLAFTIGFQIHLGH